MTIADRAVRLACARVLGVNLEESRIERWSVRPAMADDLRKIMARDPAVQSIILEQIIHWAGRNGMPRLADETATFLGMIERGEITLEIPE